MIKFFRDLFNRTTEKEAIALHVAGATVRHASPFQTLESYKNATEPSRDFLNRWGALCMVLPNTPAQIFQSLADDIRAVDKEICLQLLGHFDWRTRTVGAYFAAVKGYDDLIEIIGVHLLKSEVCFAGETYAHVLSYFNTPASVKYLDNYLEYYLLQTNLYFDQVSVMHALDYLDGINNTQFTVRHLPAFNSLTRSWEMKTTGASDRKFMSDVVKTFNVLRALE
ncbi:DUF6000 family protein [Chitinophaga sp. Cy-1792]|uniref:DUF6000 family protein n=1 Tax=Chitinophaga sp. Cy-1792 TaxID=2608339 RepID=UPI00141DE3DA|nr:DUF6000 family protein [Chitinophaga sp. Cy-1792]NIG52891.1 hypothetical protein [Chitinophaga sp. Cy-1792]